MLGLSSLICASFVHCVVTFHSAIIWFLFLTSCPSSKSAVIDSILLKKYIFYIFIWNLSQPFLIKYVFLPYEILSFQYGILHLMNHKVPSFITSSSLYFFIRNVVFSISFKHLKILFSQIKKIWCSTVREMTDEINVYWKFS